MRLMICARLMVILSLVGCGTHPAGKHGEAKIVQKGGHDDHDHGPGPHGGTIIEFGKWHGEFCMDHAKKQATVYILDGDAKKNVAIKAGKLNLSIKSPSFQVELLAQPMDGEAAGTSSRFVAVHDNFAKEQEFAGTVSAEVDGKPYSGDFKEEAGHDKKGK